MVAGFLRRVVIGVVTAGLLGTGLVAVAAPASAATQIGNDISWPQCAPPAGYGNPMPATNVGFVVLGLTAGVAFTTNPCVSDQARWIRDHARPFHAYTMAAYPTSAQLTQYGASGPFATDSLVGRLRNVGYAEAIYSLTTLRGIGMRPPRIWIDVEKRVGQPWPEAAGNATAAGGNRAVIEGMLSAYRRAGIPAGIYSNADGWTTITDDWQRPDLPFWATVGTRGRTAAANRCLSRGLNGGPVHLAQWWTTSPDVDWNITCPGYALPSPAATLSWPAASPAHSRLGSTSAVVSAGPSRRQTWQLSVRDACTGAWVAGTSGITSDKIVARWNGSRGNGSPAGPGLYRVTLRTGTRTPPTGPAFSALHEVHIDGVAKVGGCRTTRLSGIDLYATAVATGQAAFPAARTVVLVSGESTHLVDAATAAPYARKLRAPLLLTPSAALSGSVADDLRRRGATSVIIVGGTTAVSQAVADAVRGLGITVSRVAGADRYATAALVARRVGGAKKRIVVASGEDGRITSALLAGGPAAGLGIPILLTRRTALPAATLTALGRLGSATAQVTVVGPTSAVSGEVAGALGRKARSVRRISGTDDVRTAAALTAAYAGAVGSGPVVVVSSGRGADLLAAGVLGRPILLTQRLVLPASSAAWLKSHPRTPVRVIGNPGTVAPAVLATIGR